MRLLCVAITLGCISRVVPAGPRPVCDTAVRRWDVPSSGGRALRVWFDAAAQDLDGWRPYGWRRLRFALEEWNSLRLPVRFVAAVSARESDIVVDIVPSIPGADERSGRDQAAATNLTYLESGVIVRARVLVAVASPDGGRYPLYDQQANLIHELGHALGLPYFGEASAVMATRRTGNQLTGADIALARRHYACQAGD